MLFKSLNETWVEFFCLIYRFIKRNFRMFISVKFVYIQRTVVLKESSMLPMFLCIMFYLLKQKLTRRKITSLCVLGVLLFITCVIIL